MDDAGDGQNVRAPPLEDLVRIGRSLNENSAQYILIGGFAVIAHGGGKDIDFLVEASPENVARIKAALRVLPDNAVCPSCSRLSADSLSDRLGPPILVVAA
jgi:hypothetical protein